MSSISPEPPTSANPPPALTLDGFRVDVHEIPSRYRGTLRAFAVGAGRVLREYPKAETIFTLTGHTDSTGSERHNTALGLRRAIEVARALQELMPPDVRRQVRYATRSGGEGAPVVAERTARDRARNRRVEIRAESKLPPAPPIPGPVPGPVPPPLPPPCQDLENLAWFKEEHYRLRELLSRTKLHWPGSGSKIVLDTDETKGDIASIADEVTKSLLDEVRSPIDEAILGKVGAKSLGRIVPVVELAATLEEDRRNARIMRDYDQSGPEGRRKHRQLVAEKVAKKNFARNWVAERERILYWWARYERLAAKCNELRTGVPKGPTVTAPSRPRRTR